MSANEIHVGDIGTVIEVTVQDAGVAVDISTATTKQFVFRKPDGTLLTKTAVFSVLGVDGKLKYTTVSGDLDQAGDWSLQVHLILSTGEWRSDQQFFRVFANL